MPLTRAGLPRLAPQCGGNNQIGNSSQHSSLQSLVSLGRTNTCPASNQLSKPSPRSLQVSPALAQRSLYAQHILSSPEIIGVNTTDSRHHQNAKSALKTATSEFSFIRPDSPLTLPHHHNRSSNADNLNRPQYHRSQSCLESQQQLKLRQQKMTPHLSNTVNRSQSASTKQTMERMIHSSIRPSSIYGQPSLTDKSNHNNYYCTPTDPDPIVFGPSRHNTHVGVINKVRDTKSMPKRHIRHYKQSKSDSVFATTNNRSHSIASSNNSNNGSIVQPKDSNSTDKLINRNKILSNEMFAVR